MNDQKLNTSSGNSMPLVEVQLQNITYHPKVKGSSSSTPNKRKTILNNVTPPRIEPYKLSAWMGPSGSGKTSLLSIASGMTSFLHQGDFSHESKIIINRSQDILKQGFPKGLAGVVWQDDLLLSNVTVRETITFAARLKTPFSEKDKVPRMVDEVLQELGLTHVQHSLIGANTTLNRGISGGERKRVSVATELVTKPPVIFLDEPTSGLDSTSAYELMYTLKNLAVRGGHSIVVVIHQPRTKIFDLFDSLLLLSKGEEVYSGPAVGAQKVLESCPSIGFPLPPQTNIADWIMDLIMEDEKQSSVYTKKKDSDEEEALSSIQFNRYLPRHWMNVKTKRDLTTPSSSSSTTETNKLLTLTEIQNTIPKYTASFSTQLRLLTKRAIKQTRGEKISQATIITIAFYIFFESAFWFRLPDDTNKIYERNSLIFFFIIAQGNSVVISSVPIFKRDRALLTRERSKKMYQVLPYFFAKTLADMTTTILLPCLHVIIVYWTANLRPTASAFLMFQFLFYLTLTTAQSLGLFMSALLPSLQLALTITPALVIFLFIVGGFYIPLTSMPVWISWFQFLSFATYGYCGLLATQYNGYFIPCTVDADITFQIGSSTECPLPGEEVLKSLGVTGLLANVWFNVAMLIILQVIYRAGAYTMLRVSP